MGSVMKVVPIGDFDLEWHVCAISDAGEQPLEGPDGRMYPSPEEHAEDMAAILAVARGIAALTPSQRTASRWPSHDELRATLEHLAAELGWELRFGPYEGPWNWGSLSRVGASGMIEEDIMVYASEGEGQPRYYTSAHEGILRVFAKAIANVAGPQVTFLADDWSPASFTTLFLPD